MKKTGMNVLICGSQRFEQEDFVYKTLDLFYAKSNGAIRKFFTSKFSGACEFAKNWAESKNQSLPDDKKIEIVEYAFDMVLEHKNQSFYEDAELPAYAIANDPFFKQGKDLLVSKGVNVVFCFPNAEGQLGASTENIKRFATLASIPQFDCSQLFKLVDENIKNKEPEIRKDEGEDKGLGFNNRHPNKIKP